jgi:uncharacterized protein (DUF58 family)
VAKDRERQIDRRAVGRVSRLQMRARQAMEGYYSGIHKSPFHGFSVEFAEYREYVPGDDLRYLDWRVLARSDKHFVKQFEAETNLDCYLLLDTSGSMDFSTEGETRLDYGAALAACLTLMMLRQGDQVGLVTFDDAVRNYIPPRGNARHFSAICEQLEGVGPGGDTHISGVLHEMAERIGRRNMVIIISDFFDDVDQVLRGLQHFRHRHNEVIVLHLLDPAEVDFPFDRVTMFEGMEHSEQLVVDPAVMAESYRTKMGRFLDEFMHGCREKDIDYQRMMLSEPFDKALTTYISEREQRTKK